MTEKKKPAAKTVRKPAQKKPAKRRVGAPSIKTAALSDTSAGLELNYFQVNLRAFISTTEEYKCAY
jgi:hypothetical protein